MSSSINAIFMPSSGLFPNKQLHNALSFFGEEGALFHSPQDVNMKDPIAQIKAWLFPSLITILAGIIWNDVQEIKSDVKSLMAQSNIDKTRIDNLERVIFESKPMSNAPTKRDNKETKLELALIPSTKEIEDSLQPKKRTL